ncbi:hypothetical protein LCGC14_2206460, partial [marine sediment metagenome]
MENTQLSETKQTSPILYRQGINPLFSNMYTFRQTVKVEDFVVTSIVLDTETQYTYSGKGTRTPASTVPRGFDTIDTWIDFCMFIDA